MAITALRRQVSDAAVLDWLELRERFGDFEFTAVDAGGLWHLSQPTVSRRLQTLRRHQLVMLTGRRGHRDVYQVTGWEVAA
jgi:hypothetical protein